MNINALIEKAGGVQNLADRLKVHHSTVCEWKREGFLPASRIAQIHHELNVPLPAVIACTNQVDGPRPRKRRDRAA